MALSQTHAQQKAHILVRDSADNRPVEGVEVKYYYRSSRQYAYGATTNATGYASFFIPPGGGDTLSFEDNSRFVPKKISAKIDSRQDTIKVYLSRIVIKEPVTPVDSPIIVLPVPPVPEKRIHGFVYNRKNGKPVGNAHVFLAGPGNPSARTNQDGYYEISGIKTPYTPEELLSFRLERPKYKTLRATRAFGGPDAETDFQMTLRWQYEPCNWFLMTGGISALAFGTSGLISKAAYDDYKDFKNQERAADYTRANRNNRIAIVTGSAALALGGAWFLCTFLQRRKMKKRFPDKAFFLLEKPSGTVSAGTAGVGIAHTF